MHDSTHMSFGGSAINKLEEFQFLLHFKLDSSVISIFYSTACALPSGKLHARQNSGGIIRETNIYTTR